MKALTSLCTAERPISIVLRNNCKNSLTVTIYTRSMFVLLGTAVFDVTRIKNISVKIMLAAFFFTDVKTRH